MLFAKNRLTIQSPNLAKFKQDIIKSNDKVGSLKSSWRRYYPVCPYVYSLNSTLIYFETTWKQKITQFIVFGSIFNLPHVERNHSKRAGLEPKSSWFANERFNHYTMVPWA